MKGVFIRPFPLKVANCWFLEPPNNPRSFVSCCCWWHQCCFVGILTSEVPEVPAAWVPEGPQRKIVCPTPGQITSCPPTAKEPLLEVFFNKMIGKLYESNMEDCSPIAIQLAGRGWKQFHFTSKIARNGVYVIRKIIGTRGFSYQKRIYREDCFQKREWNPFFTTCTRKWGKVIKQHDLSWDDQDNGFRVLHYLTATLDK